MILLTFYLGPPQHPHGPQNSGMNQQPQNMQSHAPQHFAPMDNGPRFHSKFLFLNIAFHRFYYKISIS